MRPTVTHTARAHGRAKTTMIRSQRFHSLAATVLLGTFTAVSLGACAAGPAPKSGPVDHLCKPTEEVGFSCELQDGRLLSMCASAGFAKFDGNPNDNPGYAYLALGTRTGEVQASYPPNPEDYKEHFYKGVPTNGIPYMFITSERGRFFFMAEQDDTDPLGAGQWTQEYLPKGWAVGSKNERRACKRILEFDNFYTMGVTHESVWRAKERERREAEETRITLP